MQHNAHRLHTKACASRYCRAVKFSMQANSVSVHSMPWAVVSATGSMSISSADQGCAGKCSESTSAPVHKLALLKARAVSNQGDTCSSSKGAISTGAASTTPMSGSTTNPCSHNSTCIPMLPHAQQRVLTAGQQQQIVLTNRHTYVLCTVMHALLARPQLNFDERLMKEFPAALNPPGTDVGAALLQRARC